MRYFRPSQQISTCLQIVSFRPGISATTCKVSAIPTFCNSSYIAGSKILAGVPRAPPIVVNYDHRMIRMDMNAALHLGRRMVDGVTH